MSDHPESDSEPSGSRIAHRGDGADSLPSRIGPYRILSMIGEGGMGFVYLAEHDKPVRRRVALKVIKPGMDSKAVLTRFEVERQALALMDHPGIARMLDAGTTPEGRPYFAMENVPGIPIDTYCDGKRLDLDQRLRLFMDVCQAVLHAHQKAVLHRDLKPSNILVADVDGKPVPKIIDFGLAKALGQALTEQTHVTHQEAIVGTPEYMSPEQIDPSALAVDTRTDLYSLGVILYRLLTGTLPFTLAFRKDVGHIGAIHGMQSLICETEPPRPSTRVTTSHELGDSAARSMRIPTGTLFRRLRGDLDWIVLKSLEKDRNRRYATATDFAEDIRRHLESEPVKARPPSTAYRLRKLVRKHLGAVVSLIVFFLAVLAGGVTSTAFYFQAEERREEAELAVERERIAKREESRARAEEARQRMEAVEARNLARDKEVEAVAAKQEAERERDEVLRLSDVTDVRTLIENTEALWPCIPEKVDDMTAWLRKAEEIVARRSVHEESLHRLHQEAYLKQVQAGVIEEDGDTDPEWDQVDPPLRWRYMTTQGLLANLGELSSVITDVEKRVAFSRSVRRETFETYAAQWKEAIRSIADEAECPEYLGLEITPQLGLVPLGRDPDSSLWEFGHLQTGKIPGRDRERHLEIDPDTGLVFVLVPGGTFLMGAQNEDPGGPNYDPRSMVQEGPVHEVTLSPFFLSKYEMTQGQWERVTGKNPSYYGKGFVTRYRLHPVENVSWDDCDRLMRHLDLVIPTEAQWEYASRAGTNTPWWTGAEPSTLAGATNLADAFARSQGAPPRWPFEECLNDGFTLHAPVGRMRPNAFGLDDVHGNVAEWCRDGAGSYLAPVARGDGERQASQVDRVNRGSSYRDALDPSRASFRDRDSTYARLDNLGLRPARIIQP